jgi:hypothetical protein
MAWLAAVILSEAKDLTAGDEHDGTRTGANERGGEPFLLGVYVHHEACVAFHSQSPRSVSIVAVAECVLGIVRRDLDLG